MSHRPDAFANLHAFLQWCMPLTSEEIETERLRLALLDQSLSDARVRAFLDRLDERMLNLFRRYLEPLVQGDDIDRFALLFRAATNGGALSAIEHPAQWTAGRRDRVIDFLLDAFALARQQT